MASRCMGSKQNSDPNSCDDVSASFGELAPPCVRGRRSKPHLHSRSARWCPNARGTIVFAVFPSLCSMNLDRTETRLRWFYLKAGMTCSPTSRIGSNVMSSGKVNTKCVTPTSTYCLSFSTHWSGVPSSRGWVLA